MHATNCKSTRQVLVLTSPKNRAATSQETQGLTQKELAAGMVVSLQQIKCYEQKNLELIGSHGFSIIMLAVK